MLVNENLLGTGPSSHQIYKGIFRTSATDTNSVTFRSPQQSTRHRDRHRHLLMLTESQNGVEPITWLRFATWVGCLLGCCSVIDSSPWVHSGGRNWRHVVERSLPFLFLWILLMVGKYPYPSVYSRADIKNSQSFKWIRQKPEMNHSLPDLAT